MTTLETRNETLVVWSHDRRASTRTRRIDVIRSTAPQNANYTVKLARAKLPANTGNFTCSSQVKKPHTQFKCVTCSLPAKTGKITYFYAASTSRKIHTNCWQSHVNLPEYNGHFTGNFTCRTHANLPATSMQNCLQLQAKMHATFRQKH